MDEIRHWFFTFAGILIVVGILTLSDGYGLKLIYLGLGTAVVATILYFINKAKSG